MKKFGLYQNAIGWSFEQLRDYVIEAEKLDFNSFWMMDNVVFPDPSTGEQLEVFETWTLLPALAAVTSKIRMGPLVTPCRRRHPALLAKITTTFDRISQGRLDLGLGPGDDPIYYIPWGMTYPKASVRIAMLREEIEVLKRMWTEDRATFEGEYYHLDQAVNHPKPIQKPHPPIWIGLVLGKKLMPKLAAEVGDGLNVYNGSDRATEQLLAATAENCERIGRDFDDIKKSRNVYVIFSDEAPVTPLMRHVIKGQDELVRIRKMSLDDQRTFIQATKEKYADYSSITERFVIGNPEEIAHELKRIFGLGFDVIIVGGLERIDLLQKFREEVMPHV